MSGHAPNPHISAGQPHAHALETHHAETSEVVFTDMEWDHLRAEDFSAAKAVVLLMVGIFSTGVVLYSFVAAAVMT
jgi:hypothetical protein